MQNAAKLHVAVLMGGTSNEREISLSTGRMIVGALDSERYRVTAIDTADLLRIAAPQRAAAPAVAGSPPAAAAGALTTVPHASALEMPGAPCEETQPSSRPDVVFVALHGRGGEDGTVQGMLEFLGLPYTGSGVLASALAMDKAATKRLLASEGLPVIPDMQIKRDRVPADAALIGCVEQTLGFPVFVKPNAEGSTVGCSLVTSPAALPDAVRAALQYDTLALVERYVRGAEITVGVLEDPETGAAEALPVIEIVPRAAFYDYESKYAQGGSEHIIPARLPDALGRMAQALAVRVHNLLGCAGMSRTDMLVEGGDLYVLEVNTIPGMTPTSLLPQAAEHAGIPFPALLDRLIACALKRSGR